MFRISSALILIFMALGVQAQNKYSEYAFEYIFSYSPYVPQGDDSRAIARFSMYNIEYDWHFDGAKKVGFYVGTTFRNNGLIWNDGDKHKRRALSIGIPAVLKLGNFNTDSTCFLVGANIDLLFHFKAKDWDMGAKVKRSKWLSDEVNLIQPSLMLGYQSHGGFLKLRYYPLNFLNSQYKDPITNSFVYSNMSSPLFSVSVGISINKMDDDEVEPENNLDEFD